MTYLIPSSGGHAGPPLRHNAQMCSNNINDGERLSRENRGIKNNFQASKVVMGWGFAGGGGADAKEFVGQVPWHLTLLIIKSGTLNKRKKSGRRRPDLPNQI